MANTKIQWTDKTWNPVRGCSIVSPGCHNCYAMKTAHRFDKPGQPYEGLTKLGPHGAQWNGEVRCVPERLSEPLSWRKPCMVFVNSMSDLFHEKVPDEFIDQVFAVMALCPKHTFQVLTKRPERMRKYLLHYKPGSICDASIKTFGRYLHIGEWKEHDEGSYRKLIPPQWPLLNVWLGVSCEDQQRVDERIPHLLQTPAAVRFVSAEPLLSRMELPTVTDKGDDIDDDDERDASELPETIIGACLENIGPRRIDWVIVGGESGPNARPCEIDWIRSIVKQCKATGVACFVKQLGQEVIWNGFQGGYGDGPSDCWPDHVRKTATDTREGKWSLRLRDPKGGDPSEWPEDLRVREMPG